MAADLAQRSSTLPSLPSPHTASVATQTTFTPGETFMLQLMPLGKQADF